MDIPQNRWRISAVLLLIVLTTAVYWPVRHYDFVNYDDEMYVVNNRHVRAGMTGEGLRWAFTSRETGHWHPLTWISHMADGQLFSKNPAGHHWTNVLIHLVNTLLLLGLLRRMTGRFWRSLLVTACFALHPLNVESVAWISERKNVLSTTFWFLTLWAYLSYAAAPGIRRYALLFLAFLLGLLTKPMLVTLPFVLLLLDFWPLRRLRPFQMNKEEKTDVGDRTPFPGSPFSRLVLEKIPLFLLAALSAALTLGAAGSVDTITGIEEVSLSQRLMNAVVSYADYIGLMICPHDLAVLYPYPQGWSPLRVGGALLLLIGVSGIALLQARRRPYWPVGWFWYLGTLVPVIGLVQVGAQAIADRYAYLPMIGLFILIVWAVSDASRRWPQRRILLAALSALIVAGMSLSTVRQLSFWQNSETLFRRALSVTENNHIAHSNLGAAMMRAGRSEEAMAHYAAALRIRPLPEYHNNLGKMLAEQGRTEEAMAHYREALREKPAYAEALNNIGTVLGRQGKLEEALIHFNRAVALKPDYADAHNNLGFALALQGKHGAAVPHYETALRFNPDHPGIYHNLGVSLMALGRREEASERFREALRLRPGDAEILQRLREESTGAQEGRRPPRTGNR